MMSEHESCVPDHGSVSVNQQLVVVSQAPPPPVSARWALAWERRAPQGLHPPGTLHRSKPPHTRRGPYSLRPWLTLATRFHPCVCAVWALPQPVGWVRWGPSGWQRRRPRDSPPRAGCWVLPRPSTRSPTPRSSSTRSSRRPSAPSSRVRAPGATPAQRKIPRNAKWSPVLTRMRKQRNTFSPGPQWRQKGGVRA